MAKQLNVPDVYAFEIDVIDADGREKKFGARGVRGIRTEEDMLDHLRRHPATLNDSKGRPPRRFVGLRLIPAPDPAAASNYLPKLPPGLERNVAKSEGRDEDADRAGPPKQVRDVANPYAP